MSQINISQTPTPRSIDIVGKRSRAADTAFDTLVDAMNPLQQLPGVGQAYRAVSGDKTSNGAQLAGHVAIGGALAGPIGMAAGAGLFVLEKALPGVFHFVGKLFSSGKNADTKADMPALVGEAPAAAARSPLIEGLDRRPGTGPRPAPRIGTAAPALSPAQFDVLLQSLGAQPVPGGSGATSDVAALIQTNLDKYRRQQQAAASR